MAAALENVLMAVDTPTPNQNNGTFCYSLDDGQWHTQPHLGVTALCVWQGKDDENEVYSGGYHAVVWTEEMTEADYVQTGDSGQATSGGNKTLTDTGGGWTANEWLGSTIYKTNYATGTVETQVVYSNTSNAITIIGIWTVNPQLDDYYVIIKKQKGDSGQATSGAASTLTDTGSSWTTNKWAGLTIHKSIFATGVTESKTIVSNTANIITISGKWAVNPVNTDYYVIVKPLLALDLSLNWRTPRLVFDTLHNAKRYFEMMGMMTGNDRVDISYRVEDDSNRSGVFQETLSYGTTFWDTDLWATSTEANRLVWVAASPTRFEWNFPDNAEGRFIVIEFSLETQLAFSLQSFTLAYKTYVGNSWR
jgi:hypothetical protein